MNTTKVEGKHIKTLTLYALSTCIWCKKVKQLLEELGIAYEYVFVDMLDDENQNSALKTLSTFNQRESFPTLVIDNKECVVGFKPQEIRGKLGI